LLTPAVIAQDEGLIPDNPPEVSWKDLPRSEQIESIVDALYLGAEGAVNRAALELENASYDELYSYVESLSTAILEITESEDFAKMVGEPEVLELFNSLLRDLPSFFSALFLAPESDFSAIFSYINSFLQFIPYMPEILISFMAFTSNIPEIIASMPIYMETLKNPILESIPVCIESGMPILCVWLPKLLCLELPGLVSSDAMLTFLLECCNTFGIEPLVALRSCCFSALPDYGLAMLNSCVHLIVNIPEVIIGTIAALCLDLPIFIIDSVSLLVQGAIGTLLSSVISVCIGAVNLAGLYLACGTALITMIRSTYTLAFITEPLLGIAQPVASLCSELLSPEAIINLLEVIFELI
jgi:hypothetical protein